MEDSETEVPVRGNLPQDVEETDGIGAAGDGDPDGLAGFDHAVAGDGGGNLVGEGEQGNSIVGAAEAIDSRLVLVRQVEQ